MEYSHTITAMERGATKNSGSPMYRCQTADGQRVNVFQHSDPVKDSFLLFERAGYGAEMQALGIGERLEWTGAPIRVVMQPDGSWWKVTAVEPRPEGAEPDTLWQPDVMAYRRRARQQANWLTHLVVGFDVIDVESTGLKVDDEIISIAIIDSGSAVKLDTLVRPLNMSKMNRLGKNGTKASEIHGITAEDLDEVPYLVDVYDNLRQLNGVNIVGYNVRFDLQMLDRNFADNQIPLPIYDSIWDVAQIVAEFIGNWNAKRGWFEMISLDEACNMFGIERDLKHDAKADALATLHLVKAMAEADVETWGKHPF